MSRVGKQPVQVPSGVKAAIAPGSVTIEGPKGKIQHKFPEHIVVKEQEGELVVSPKLNNPQAKADWGTTRAMLKNMIKGVTEGWKRSLELNGVGFTAKMNGNKLVVTTGFSHEVGFDIPKGVSCQVTKTTIDLESVDRHQVGQLAAKIRWTWPPEPYLGKGIKYKEESIRRKAGKTGK